MKRYSGSHDVPHHTCQSLGEIAEGPGQVRITPEQFTVRLAVEQEHDADAIRGTHDLETTDRYKALVVEHAGRCCCCGEHIGEVDRCPFCRSQQRFAGQRNSAQRKSIGGFCGKRK
jgi:hypothetical protein